MKLGIMHLFRLVEDKNKYKNLAFFHGYRYRRLSKIACPGCLAMETNKVKKCAVRKIMFCTGLTRADKAGQKSIVPA
jgi:hypothetical protein